jgi:hypothetical protein
MRCCKVNEVEIDVDNNVRSLVLYLWWWNHFINLLILNISNVNDNTKSLSFWLTLFFSVNLSLLVYWFEDTNVMIKIIMETLFIEELFNFIILKVKEKSFTETEKNMILFYKSKKFD